ncbi:hypothetical protein [Rhizobium sp. 9140]|uniref:hypothetical protein n=1 Tax=Rhizobium sp. 9140 TaxID=1761900 RepID=UPI000794A634|nr:hypothetical protein [Rhizobium sp. 9140]CZT36377.1 hypothetical protein GA0004734_00033760 [Rhizobium sp. 9140]
MKELILTQLLPPLFDFIVIALLSAISAVFYRWTGIQIEAKHRDALQSALANGAKLLLQPGGSADDAIDYVLRSVPDALKRFGKLSRPDIHSLLEPHILALPTLPGAVETPNDRLQVVVSSAVTPDTVMEQVEKGVHKGLEALRRTSGRGGYTGSPISHPVAGVVLDPGPLQRD